MKKDEDGQTRPSFLQSETVEVKGGKFIIVQPDRFVFAACTVKDDFLRGATQRLSVLARLARVCVY